MPDFDLAILKLLFFSLMIVLVVELFFTFGFDKEDEEEEGGWK
ncbi:MAG: hypothetical protein ACKO0Z_05205 [Betaproteobacteria bacterium]